MPSDTHIDELRIEVSIRCGMYADARDSKEVEGMRSAIDSIESLIRQREQAAKREVLERLRMDEKNENVWDQMRGMGAVQWIRMFNAVIDAELKKLGE